MKSYINSFITVWKQNVDVQTEQKVKSKNRTEYERYQKEYLPLDQVNPGEQILTWLSLHTCTVAPRSPEMNYSRMNGVSKVSKKK